MRSPGVRVMQLIEHGNQPWEEYLYMNELLNNFFSEDTPSFDRNIHYDLYYIIPNVTDKRRVNIYVNFKATEIISGSCIDDGGADNPRNWHDQRETTSFFTPRDALNSVFSTAVSA